MNFLSFVDCMSFVGHVNHMNFPSLVSFLSFLRVCSFSPSSRKEYFNLEETIYNKESNTPCFPSSIFSFTGLAGFSYCLALWTMTVAICFRGLTSQVSTTRASLYHSGQKGLVNKLCWKLFFSSWHLLVCAKMTLCLKKEEPSGERWSLCTRPEEISLPLGASETD